MAKFLFSIPKIKVKYWLNSSENDFLFKILKQEDAIWLWNILITSILKDNVFWKKGMYIYFSTIMRNAIKTNYLSRSTFDAKCFYCYFNFSIYWLVMWWNAEYQSTWLLWLMFQYFMVIQSRFLIFVFISGQFLANFQNSFSFWKIMNSLVHFWSVTKIL